MVHVPVLERQIGPAAGDRPFDARAKNTYYPISEETMPGMLAQLMAGLPAGARLTDMVAFPPAFRAWVQIQLTGGIGGEVDRGSDRVWDYDPAGAWHLSVQSVDAAGQLQTRLPDRPMLGTVLVYDDIQYHWHLSKTAYSESDCVAQSLAEALELEVETCKERLERAADGQDKIGRAHV